MRDRNNAGETLLELMLAIAIFAITMGMGANGLGSFYLALDMQNQRVMAVNQCLSVISDMRNLRDANINTPDDPDKFQSSILDRYNNGWERNGPTELRDSKISVTYEEGDPSANPLVPTVEVQWKDLHGHTMTQRVTSAITDR